MMTGPNRMTVSLEAYGRRTTVEGAADVPLDDLLHVFHTLAIGAGFPDESWRDTVVTLAEIYRDPPESPDADSVDGARHDERRRVLDAVWDHRLEIAMGGVDTLRRVLDELETRDA